MDRYIAMCRLEVSIDFDVVNRGRLAMHLCFELKTAADINGGELIGVCTDTSIDYLCLISVCRIAP